MQLFAFNSPYRGEEGVAKFFRGNNEFVKLRAFQFQLHPLSPLYPISLFFRSERDEGNRKNPK